MSSWFGGPSPSHRSSSHRSHSHDHDNGERIAVKRRESGSNGTAKGYFVRPHSPSSRSDHHSRRDSSPKGYFVRPHSPSGRSTTSSRHIGGGGSKEGIELNGSARGLFSTVMGAAAGGRHGSSGSSYYKRRPRDGYIARLMATVRRLFRNLYHYARRNPIKLFMLVIMPLVTGGALHSILRSMGVTLPAGVAGFMGGNKADGRSGGQGGMGGGGGGGAGGVGIEQVMGIAKMFI